MRLVDRGARICENAWLVGLAVLVVIVFQASPAFSKVTGYAEDDEAAITDTEVEQDVLHPGESPSSNSRSVDGVGSQAAPKGDPDAADEAPKVPDFINYTKRAPSFGEIDCSSGVCRGARGACLPAPDYTTYQGEILATPRSSGVREPGSVTFESLTQDTRSGAESSNGYSCEEPSVPAPRADTEGGESTDAPAPAPVVITLTRSDFAKLPVEASVASAGPERGWLPAGMVNVLYVEHEVQALQTELLGTPVSVRAIPTSYHWDLGDGNTITTSKPGTPYPSEEVSATYSGEGWYNVTLTTTFAGQFSVDGGEWQDIDGTIEVASEPIALYSKSLESRLVNDDVPVDEDEDPWIPERASDTEGPQDPDARHREI